MNPTMKLIKKQRKLDRLIEIQKKQNELDARLRLKKLHLRNSLLYPSNTRKSSFSSATASSQAKKNEEYYHLQHIKRKSTKNVDHEDLYQVMIN